MRFFGSYLKCQRVQQVVKLRVPKVLSLRTKIFSITIGCFLLFSYSLSMSLSGQIEWLWICDSRGKCIRRERNREIWDSWGSMLAELSVDEVAVERELLVFPMFGVAKKRWRENLMHSYLHAWCISLVIFLISGLMKELLLNIMKVE